jgi:hypothetical protein
MKKKNTGKTAEMIVKIFAVVMISILCLVMLYASITWTYNYFTMNDEQICKNANSTLINGQCHSECNKPVNEQRTMLLIGVIAFPIFAVLLIFYLIILLKTRFKGK